MRNKAERIKSFQKIAGKMIPDNMYWKMLQDDYFEAPASGNHHGNYEGGLYDHSEQVVLKLVELTTGLGLTWSRPESPYIIGFFHDYCKVDQYVKNSQGKYEYIKGTLMAGHGEKSVMLIQDEMRLTEEERACIRYHMGAYESNAIWDNLSTAIAKYENVLWTHTADMYASHVLGF